MTSIKLLNSAYEKFLNACEYNWVNKKKLDEISEQVSLRKHERNIQHIEYDDHSIAEYILDDWSQPQNGETSHSDLVVSVESLQQTLGSNVVRPTERSKTAIVKMHALLKEIYKACYIKVLDASDENTITKEIHFLEMVLQMSSRIFGEFTRYLENMLNDFTKWGLSTVHKDSDDERVLDMAYMSNDVKVQLLTFTVLSVERNFLSAHSPSDTSIWNYPMECFTQERDNKLPDVRKLFWIRMSMARESTERTFVKPLIGKEDMDILGKLFIDFCKPFDEMNMLHKMWGSKVPTYSQKSGHLRKIHDKYSTENMKIKKSMQEKAYEQLLKKKAYHHGEKKTRTGLDFKSNNNVSMLSRLMTSLAKSISKTVLWTSIFSVLTGAVTCSFPSTSEELVPVEFQISKFTSQEIPLPTFSYKVDHNAATIDKVTIIDSMEGCQLILHIEISHVEGILSKKIGETVFYVEHPNLGCGLQKFSMLSDERNIWKEKRFCFSDCKNGVEVPLLLSATTNLTEVRNITIVPEIRNDGCKTTEQPNGFLPTILFVTCSMIFLSAMVTLLLKEYGKTVVKTILNHQDGIIEKQRMIEEKN